MRFKIFALTFIISTGIIFCIPSDVLAAAAKKPPEKKPLIVQKVPVKKTSAKTVKKVTKKIVVAPNPRTTQLLIASTKELRLQPGETYTMRFGFKNTGKVAWNVAELRADGKDAATLYNPTWISKTVLATSTSAVKIGALQFFDFQLQAPDQPGAYFLSGSLVADGKEVFGGVIGLSIEVAPSEAGQISEILQPEPRIKVALGTIEGGALVRTIGDYDFVLPDGSRALEIPGGSKVLWQYDQPSKTYLITINGVATSSPALYRLQARTPDGRVIIHDHADKPTWNKSLNYNDFHGDMELRWSDKMIGLWVINELPFETYLKGLIETGNSDPIEFQKATFVAARSYAYINLPDGKKYPNRLWDVHALWDQVYKGYSAEKSNPNGVLAVDATRGEVVTYQGRPVVTPYFTRSDGSTRGWKSVWGGTDKPWLQPVDALYDHGKKMWGHGVGMSATDAKMRVKKDGWNYEQVLKYYYTGTAIRKVFE